jgi:hypothetical protein
MEGFILDIMAIAMCRYCGYLLVIGDNWLGKREKGARPYFLPVTFGGAK